MRHSVQSFLPRDATQPRPMPLCGVCPSVCLSVTFVYSVKTSKHVSYKNVSSSGSHTTSQTIDVKTLRINNFKKFKNVIKTFTSICHLKARYMQVLTLCTSVRLTYRNSMTVSVKQNRHFCNIRSEHSINDAASSHLFSMYTT